MPIDHATFIDQLERRFPELVAGFDQAGRGLLHCEMGRFAQATEAAVDAGRAWRTEQYCRFVGSVTGHGSDAVGNAIEVSDLEYLAFGVATPLRRATYRARMSADVLAAVRRIDGRGRW